MHIVNRPKHALAAYLLVITGLLFPGEVAAYIDPGTSGMLSQVLYVLFYGALGVFFYMLRYIKQYGAQVKQFLAKLIGRS